MFIVYWIINEDSTKTYVGYSSNLNKRLQEHKGKKVYSTKNFGNFKAFILELIDTEPEAKLREKYWKSRSGRRKLTVIFPKYIK